jgi:hypothetical protein
MTALLGILGLKLFYFSAQNTSLHGLLAFTVSVEKSAVILMGLSLYPNCFFCLLSLFCLLIVFNYNMLCRGSLLVMTIWCPAGFLYPDGNLFLKVWQFFCYCFVECISYAIGLHLFSFDAHDWSFDGISEFLHIPSTTLQSFL